MLQKGWTTKMHYTGDMYQYATLLELLYAPLFPNMSVLWHPVSILIAFTTVSNHRADVCDFFIIILAYLHHQSESPIMRTGTMVFSPLFVFPVPAQR